MTSGRCCVDMIDIAFFLEKKVTDADLISECLWPEPIAIVASPGTLGGERAWMSRL